MRAALSIIMITDDFQKYDYKPPVTVTFVDVPSTKYYYEAVNWAVGKGITTGVGNNRFNPNGQCTRGQVVTFLYRASK